MPWLKLTLTCRRDHADELGELLNKFEPASLSFGPASNEPVYGEGTADAGYWDRTAVSALFGPDLETDILIACARNLLGPGNILDCRLGYVADEDWLESHKAGFSPMVFGARLCVCPSWHVPPAGIEHVIHLDPGLAFGTGAHATTSMCLEWLLREALQGRDVIDYGSGSGILGIAAAMLGARAVTAVDVDPQALQATAANAENNSLGHRVSPVPPGDTRIETADVLVANILMNPLLELKETFTRLLGPGGRLALSGILASQAVACMQAYAPEFDLQDPVYRDEWALLAGTRRRV